MALIRNLRNFDEQGIGREADRSRRCSARITDPDEVAKARLFPYQVWAAYKARPVATTWKRALGFTLDHTTTNVPVLDRTLVVDRRVRFDAGTGHGQVDDDPRRGRRRHGCGDRAAGDQRPTS